MSKKKKLDILPCIICDKTLSDVGSGDVNHPYGAVVFHAMGQYGSTAFDPMDSSFLEINVCDECLLKAADKNRILLREPARTKSAQKVRNTYWDGEG